MKVLTTAIEGVVILEPEVFGDARGYFFESYSQRKFDEQVRSVRFVQDNESHSRYGVLRGLHFQKGRYAQSKLVRVVRGRVLDVAVDIRRGSPTFGRHVSVELSGDNKRQFFIPRGFAHGFAVLSDEATFQYKCDNPYMYQVFKPTILNSHSLWLMESQSKSTAKPQSLRQAPVHCDSISKLPVITSRCKSTCDQQNAKDGNTQGSPFGRFAWPCVFSAPAFNSLPAGKLTSKITLLLTKQDRKLN